jgi:hypothetical protein
LWPDSEITVIELITSLRRTVIKNSINGSNELLSAAARAFNVAQASLTTEDLRSDNLTSN